MVFVVGINRQPSLLPKAAAMSSVPPVSQLGDPPWEIATLFPPQGYQLTLGHLLRRFDDFVRVRRLGTVLMAAFPIKLRDGLFRTPDIDFMHRDNPRRRNNRFWQGADLVVEVVSEDDPDRDWETKRIEYAAAGIPEYWIVDPRDETVTVLTLPAGQSEYAEAGKYTRGQTAASLLLDGLTVDVAEVFSQA
jgi:Uma2 family endonuclease